MTISQIKHSVSMFRPQEGAGGKQTEEVPSSHKPVLASLLPEGSEVRQRGGPLTSSSQLCPQEGLSLETLGMNWRGYSQTKALRTMGAATQVA